MVGDRMIKIAKFFALPAPDRALLFQSLTAIVAMRAGVWMLPFARARLRAEEVDSDRPVELYQPPRHLLDHFLFRELSLHCSTYRRSSEVTAVQMLPTPWMATPPRGC